MQDQFTGDHKNRSFARRKSWKKGLRKRKKEDIIKKILSANNSEV